MRGRGRPQTDHLDVVRRCAQVLDREPDAGTRRVQTIVRANRADIVRVVRVLKEYRAAKSPLDASDAVLINAANVRRHS